MRAVAYAEMYKGNYKQTEEWILKALALAQEHQFVSEERKCYIVLYELALVADRDYVKNQRYVYKSDSVEQLILTEKIVRATGEMQIKYETEKKELRISSLEEERRLMWIIGIVGGAGLFIVIVALLFRQLWMKKRAQLIATQSVLDGETQERTRLARDLHDGLGGYLTGVRLKLNEMKREGMIIDTDDVGSFDTVLDMLDTSIRELRRVAHNMMPESLSRYGLKVALTDFCRSISIIEFGWFGSEARMGRQVEVIAYRIVLELVNNALKHSGAKHILVHVVQNPDRIALTVEDDGCGFDASAKGGGGAGISNIRTRVASVGGTMDVYSKKGEGSEINVELKIEG
jgi:signal transduction histidine kinase